MFDGSFAIVILGRLAAFGITTVGVAVISRTGAGRWHRPSIVLPEMDDVLAVAYRRAGEGLAMARDQLVRKRSPPWLWVGIYRVAKSCAPIGHKKIVYSEQRKGDITC